MFCFFLKILFKDKKPYQSEGLALSGKKSSENNFSAVVVVVIVFFFLSALNFKVNSFPGYTLNNKMSDFPLKFGQFVGEPQFIEDEMIKASGADEAFNGIYYDTNSKFYSLYIGYRGKPFGESINFFHSPNICMPSSGWETISSESKIIEKVHYFNTLPVHEMVVEKIGSKQLVYFWFQTNKQPSSNVNVNRFHLSIHAITNANTSDLFVRPITSINDKETLEETRGRLDDFVKEMMPVLIEYIEKNEQLTKS